MSEPSVEEIVAAFDAGPPHFKYLDQNESRALIASWRERGEVAEAMRQLENENRRLRETLAGVRHVAEWAERSRYTFGTVTMIDAALKDKP